jgi:hypothetical protein
VSHDHAAYMRQWRITRKENAEAERQRAMAQVWDECVTELHRLNEIDADAVLAALDANPYRDVSRGTST